MNYSKMSDYDINEACAKIIGKEMGGYFCPCWEWADAGPIIEKYSICIEKETSMCCEVCNDLYETEMWEAFHSIKHFSFSHSNPLRAAMIVFLMMQESA